MTITAKNAKTQIFLDPMTSSAGSIMNLSDVLKCLYLGENLSIYATERFILDNELFYSHEKAKSVKNAVLGKLEKTSKPKFRPDHLDRTI